MLVVDGVGLEGRVVDVWESSKGAQLSTVYKVNEYIYIFIYLSVYRNRQTEGMR